MREGRCQGTPKWDPVPPLSNVCPRASGSPALSLRFICRTFSVAAIGFSLPHFSLPCSSTKCLQSPRVSQTHTGSWGHSSERGAASGSPMYLPSFKLHSFRLLCASVSPFCNMGRKKCCLSQEAAGRILRDDQSWAYQFLLISLTLESAGQRGGVLICELWSHGRCWKPGSVLAQAELRGG